MAILRVAVPSPLRRSFDYLPPASLSPEQVAALRPGVRVLVPFGRREVTGVLLEQSDLTDVSADKLKQALAVLDDSPLFPEHLMDLFLWAAAYYQHPVGDVFSTLLPALLRQGRPAELKRKKKQSSDDPTPGTSPVREPALALNAEQSAASTAITQSAGSFQCFLLDGVTGSGKTEVYLQTIAAVITAGRQALVLVPEISLTPQTISRFSQRFECRIAVMHSGLTPRERLNAWLDAASGEAGIVIGTRSAIFTPLARPGILIIDEEHDGSFKQQDGFRYSARDLGIMRGHRENMPVVLGSATPSLESLQNALSGRYRHLRLRSRAGSATSPVYRLLDTNGVPLHAGIAEETLRLIDSHLQRQGQVLVFINRRGFSPTLQCQDCGWVAECRRCDARMTLHRHPPHLRCHHCESRAQVPPVCPQCRTGQLNALGTGTERSEALLTERFPHTRIIRVDRDTTRRRNELDLLLAEVQTGVPCILTGTQMLAKGHHFPAVTLVVVLDADGGLFSADFRGQEHMAQLLVQVAGRSGRAEAPGEVLIQTRHSTHDMLQTLIREGYPAFAEALLREREASSMPPFSHLALLRAEAGNLQNPERFLNTVRGAASALIRQHGLNRGAQAVTLLGPLPAPMEKRAGKFRAQLLIQAPQRNVLQFLLGQLCPQIETLKESRLVRWSIDVDPQDMT
jgi:primosomal protein N' (replication factor Y) (superfamily II helicase)